MTIGTLRITLPQNFDNLLDDLKNISSLLELKPVNPSFGKILAWNDEGDEVELKELSADELMGKRVQSISFWNSDGSDLVVSWQLVGDLWSLGFSEARGAYSMLEKVFGYLARKMSMHPFRTSNDQPVMVFGFE
ncbi:hypothetical protein [uncultured Variovorax sp.]|uniref:hypothetical protein n=1 Tax=uncultured Variovorax sp. TaxID=114708 RepID=UPI0025D868DE|nr:hypothetical protein [uncultured Variovorax sp.]